MNANIAAVLYLVSSVLFILALRGLSSPETSRAGNIYGMVGMGLAVVTTMFVLPNAQAWLWILIALLIGGTIGTVTALKIKMTAMPQLVAAFHSLVGLAAVLVAAAALYNPQAYGIVYPGTEQVKLASLIEMGLGVVIGAITFSGSIIAFAKLQALMSGAPIIFKGQHLVNLGIGIAIVVLLAIFAMTQSREVFWLMTLLAFVVGFLIIIPIGGADMPVVVSMLNSYSGWAAA
ncbi:MAG: NAD(P)(+) transhydrogenase (Re/Si-specific) subunit beta, partial [Alphaproteobacteria bacterium]|nr:NAD(P)(+) transhydrogenase (Re/Si-specific) subunit beta [Alphaproteobacteria bacterium]